MSLVRFALSSATGTTPASQFDGSFQSPPAGFVHVIWAWSGKRKAAFDEAARLPLEDDDAHMLRRASTAGGKKGE